MAGGLLIGDLNNVHGCHYKLNPQYIHEVYKEKKMYMYE